MGSLDPDPDPGGQKITNKNRKKLVIFYKCWMFYLRTEGRPLSRPSDKEITIFGPKKDIKQF
jgi:hypothetical protein